ncbi:MAG: PD-(D/E)XK nuclease family protein [Lachnospiraceae bacterium]|nr:PD-(D/E)XK nuclease family protein [Lachnospiraceae bacterium]
MSLRFYFGPSGAGKSTQVYKEILERAGKDLRTNYLVIVPDQFTMQTQKELVTRSACGGIMNIDVLSFGRLTHRILEEVGWENVPVLDDTGKSLVLQRVAGTLAEELPTLGGFLKRQGYIHEAKSAISEFMQYGIGTEDVAELIRFAEGHGALARKLRDLEVLYKGFMEYISGNFITTEEKLDVLTRSLGKSRLLPGSVVIFDGFTGFTPIQNRVIRELMRLCREVIFTVTLGEGENPYVLDGEQKLFHLSKKTVADLERMAGENDVPRGRDVFLTGGTASGAQNRYCRETEVVLNTAHRFAASGALEHLERNLFRYPAAVYAQDAQDEIRISEMLSPREEVHQVGLEISRLIREQGMLYRDIALVAGDLAGYAPYVETEFARMGIPCFLDRTRGIVLNPVIEYMQSALEVYAQDFSYQSVFHYLRCGLCDIARDDVDALENYCIQTGIRGEKKWSRLFTRKTKQMGQDEEQLAQINAVRQAFYEQISGLDIPHKAPAGTYVEKLYAFCEANAVQRKLDQFAERFLAENEPSRAKEYEQIYRLVLQLLEQIHDLLGEEEVTLQEFQDILAAGFGEIEVGTIPQNVDRVTVGDIERTRLKQVKVLFLLGVNDGNIPKGTSKGGIISDIDREYLKGAGLELAPSPRQQMYIQRLYLYLNLTKPSKRLYLSYAKVNSAGKSLRPAYLIDVIKGLFPAVRVDYPQERPVTEQIVNPVQGREFLARMLREYVEGTLPVQEEVFAPIYRVYGQIDGGEDRKRLEEAAFTRYQDSGLSRLVAGLLYGRQLQNSVSRLETFAACAYRHFLQYGLSLKEREEFGFEAVDMGNIYHDVLEHFGHGLQERAYTWFDFPEAYAGEAVRRALESCAAEYGDTVLYSSARNEYAITRMERILTRTVLTIQRQLRKGSFRPEAYELSFRFTDDLESVHIALSEEEKMHLNGRIDRLDIAEDDAHVYVKVVDYKSGDKDFDLVALYYGLQLQLVVYMNAAMEREAKRHPDKEVVPAAMLYYHVEDPMVESVEEMDAEELEERIRRELRMNGVVNADPAIVDKLDSALEKTSDVIPVSRNKDGSFSRNSSVMTREQFQVVSDYVGRKIVDIGRQMLDGCIRVNPYERGTQEACTYCPYKKVCGFDSAIPGYEKRKLHKMEADEIFEQMKE